MTVGLVVVFLIFLKVQFYYVDHASNAVSSSDGHPSIVEIHNPAPVHGADGGVHVQPTKKLRQSLQQESLTRDYVPLRLPEGSFTRSFTYDEPFCSSPKFDNVNDLPGPLIIGGQGDSGTRGVRMFFEILGVKWEPSRSKESTGDDNNFLQKLGHVLYGEILPQIDANFEVPLKDRQKLSELKPKLKNGNIAPDDIYADYIRQLAVHKDHQIEPYFRQKFCEALQSTWKVVSETPGDSPLALIQSPFNYKKTDPAYLPLWGWKNPRSVLYMRQWDQMFRGRSKMLHVIRDGRDVAVGELRVLATVVCAGFYHGYTNAVEVQGIWEDGTRRESIRREWDQATSKSPWGFDCRKNPTNHLNFWAVYNRALYDFGKTYLGPKRYLALRVEDIALDPNPHPTVERVMDFLGLADVHYVPKYGSRDAFVEAVVGKITGHSKSYGGNKYTTKMREDYMQQVFDVRRDNTSVAYQSLKFFGYRVDDWGLEQMAWTATHG